MPVLVLLQFPLPCGSVVFQTGILGFAGFEKSENRIVAVVAAGVFRKQQAPQEIARLVIIVLLAQTVSAVPADHFSQTVIVLTRVQRGTTTHRHSDKKALRKEREKKIAMGHKEDDHEEEQTWQQTMG